MCSHKRTGQTLLEEKKICKKKDSPQITQEHGTNEIPHPPPFFFKSFLFFNLHKFEKQTAFARLS